MGSLPEEGWEHTRVTGLWNETDGGSLTTVHEYQDTNQVTRLTVTDSGGNVATTNITVVQHPLAITLNPVSDSLWLPKVKVSGTISDPTYAVWVNGVKGIVSISGAWTATDVPVTQGGMASFTIRAFAPGELQPDGSTN